MKTLWTKSLQGSTYVTQSWLNRVVRSFWNKSMKNTLHNMKSRQIWASLPCRHSWVLIPVRSLKRVNFVRKGQYWRGMKRRKWFKTNFKKGKLYHPSIKRLSCLCNSLCPSFFHLLLLFSLLSCFPLSPSFFPSLHLSCSSWQPLDLYKSGGGGYWSDHGLCSLPYLFGPQLWRLFR